MKKYVLSFVVLGCLFAGASSQTFAEVLVRTFVGQQSVTITNDNCQVGEETCNCATAKVPSTDLADGSETIQVIDCEHVVYVKKIFHGTLAYTIFTFVDNWECEIHKTDPAASTCKLHIIPTVLGHEITEVVVIVGPSNVQTTVTTNDEIQVSCSSDIGSSCNINPSLPEIDVSQIETRIRNAMPNIVIVSQQFFSAINVIVAKPILGKILVGSVAVAQTQIVFVTAVLFGPI